MNQVLPESVAYQAQDPQKLLYDWTLSLYSNNLSIFKFLHNQIETLLTHGLIMIAVTSTYKYLLRC